MRAGTPLATADRHYSTIFAATGAPLLTLHGEFDQQFPRRHAESLAARVGGSKLVVIPNAGHFARMDAPVEWSAAVANFIGA